jgi:mannose-6-phosphate isomerase-like protein (cupin superfamily)
MPTIPRNQYTPYVSPPGAGTPASIRRFGTLIKVSADDTAGLYCVLEHTLAPETVAMPMHLHRRETKTLYAIEGNLSVQVGTNIVVAAPGTAVVIPAQTSHTFWNASEDKAVRFCAIIAPGGLERYYEEVAAVVPARGAPNMDAVLAISEKFGVEVDLLSLYDIIERHSVHLA